MASSLQHDDTQGRPTRIAVSSAASMTDSHIVDTIPLHDPPSAGTPKPMTLPALLRQNVPGYRATAMAQKSRVAQLKDGKGSSSAPSGSNGKMGKRKQRRWENANFHGSSVIKPRSSDYSPFQPSSSPTFPSPPPSTFYPYRSSFSSSASNPADPSHVPENVFDDTKAADYGRFSLPIKGLKRSTRRIVSDGGAGEEIVDCVDEQLRDWLGGTHVFLNPASTTSSGAMTILDLEEDGDNATGPTIAQVSGLPHSLIWAIEDPFVRFLVHAIARYYRVVSFTKTVSSPSSSSSSSSIHSSRHLVYLLRPNMPARTIDPLSKVGLETPPSTEWEVSSVTSGGEETETGSSSSAVTSDVETELETESESASLLGEEEDVEEEGEGDETVQAIPVHELHLEEEPSLATTSTAPTRRLSFRGRSALLPTPALSDIDSGAEVEDLSEDDSDSVHSLSQSVESLSYPSPSSERDCNRPSARTSAAFISTGLRDNSISRDPSPVRTRMPLQSRRANQLPVVQQSLIPSVQKLNNAKSKESKGWRMPETGFKEWVLVK